MVVTTAVVTAVALALIVASRQRGIMATTRYAVGLACIVSGALVGFVAPILAPSDFPAWGYVLGGLGFYCGSLSVLSILMPDWRGVSTDDLARSASTAALISVMMSVLADAPFSTPANWLVLELTAALAAAHAWWRVATVRRNVSRTDGTLLQIFAALTPSSVVCRLLEESGVMPGAATFAVVPLVASVMSAVVFLLRRLLFSVDHVPAERTHVRPDTRHLWWDGFAIAASGFLLFFSTNGLPVGTASLGIIVVSAIVIRHAVAIREFHELQSAARAQAERFQTILAQCQDAMIVAQRESLRVVYLAPGALRLVDHVPGDAPSVHDLIPDAGQDLERAIHESCVHGRTTYAAWSTPTGRHAEAAVAAGVETVRITVYDVTEVTKLRAHLDSLAHVDHLTGVPSRREMGQRVRDHAGTEHVALLFIDLNGFKNVNDQGGHAAGDAVLTTCAARLCETVGTSGVVGRWGGDEFLIILTCPSDDARHVEAIAQAIRASLCDPVEVHGRRWTISPAIGATWLSDNPDQSIHDADTAMYEAKSRGEVLTWATTAQATPAASASCSSLAELERALREQTFEAFGQPIMDTTSGAVHSIELLMRWRDSAGELHAPVEVMHYAMSTGCSDIIARWATATAIEMLRNDSGIPLAVNMCIADLTRDNFINELLRDVLDANLPAGSLIIEISEEEPLRDFAVARECLELLATAGIEVHLDDYFTGYATIEQLVELPFSGVKVDRSVTARLAAEPIMATALRHLMTYAHGRSMDVIIEGVETAADVTAMRECGAGLGQGYLWAKPRPLAEALEAAALPQPVSEASS